MHQQAERLFGIVTQVNQYRDWLELLILFHQQNPTAVLGDENIASSVVSGCAEWTNSLVQCVGEGIVKIELSMREGMFLLSRVHLSPKTTLS